MDLSPHGRHDRMPPKNPWYLITSDEIDIIKESLQGTGASLFISEDRIGKILQLLDDVRDRRP
ncbi:MAG: hypothetical protein ABSE13_07855 [Methanoregula sp.]